MIQIVNSTLPLGLDGYAVSCEDSFIDALKTPKGSVIGNLDYGTDFHKLKHRPFNSSWLIDFRRYCKDACSFDPRLTYRGLRFDESEVSNGRLYFEIQIGYYRLKGLVNV